MDLLKIDQFERSNGKGSFPWFRTLTANECNEVKENIAQALRLESNATEDRVLHRILELHADKRKNVDESFDLASELASEGVDPSRKILVNWHRFDKIDEMNLLDFSRNLEDIWYPRADDVEIFDSSFSWIASIFYFSVFQFYRLLPPSRPPAVSEK